MTHRDIIVIGASAGGVEAVTRLVSELPADLPAAVFVTIHFPRAAQSVLPRILARAGRLPAEHPRDGQTIEHGRIYVAPPDWHILLQPGRVRCVRGPTENGNRPAVDPMFRSAALSYGPRVVGVILTGNLDDGTAGLYAIRRRGGVAVAQAPDDAMFPSMPTSVIDHGIVHHVVPLHEMAALLQRLLREPIPTPTEAPVHDDATKENSLSTLETALMTDSDAHPGTPSPYGCPDCGGVLWSLEDGDFLRFRCRVGHGWTHDGLLLEQTETLDTALWTALRALEENASLNLTMAARARQRGNEPMSQRYAAIAEIAQRRAQLIRGVLAGDNRLAAPGDDVSPALADAQREITFPPDSTP